MSFFYRCFDGSARNDLSKTNYNRCQSESSSDLRAENPCEVDGTRQNCSGRRQSWFLNKDENINLSFVVFAHKMQHSANTAAISHVKYTSLLFSTA